MHRWLAVLALIPGLAWGQSCTDTVGVGGAATYGHRDWDLATPGPVAHSASPVLSMTCEGGGVWLGVDATPGLRHSYGELVSRGSVGFTAHVGIELWAEDVRIAPELFSNGVAHGFGVRVGAWDFPGELRLGMLPGRDPTLLASVTLDLRRAWDPGEESGLDIGWNHADVRLRHGFELGQFTGYRLEVGGQWRGPSMGLRAGTVTQLRNQATVQPLAVGFVDLPLGPEGLTGLELSMGWTRRSGEDQPVAGVRVLFDTGESPVHFYSGRTWGLGPERWWVGDFGIGMMW